MRSVAAFTVLVTLAAVIALVALLAYTPALARTDAVTDGVRLVFVMTTGLVFAAGALGACLYNMRGLSKHTAQNDYEARYNLSYYLRPMAGGISGLIVFFLLLGGGLTLSIGTSADNASWATFFGRMPYVAMALLAGYGSHEFMLKLKDLADSLFALRRDPNR